MVRSNLRTRVAIAAASLTVVLASTAALAQDDGAPSGAPWPGAELVDAASVTAGHDRFVAGGTDGLVPPTARVWSSDDGLTWERSLLPNAASGSSVAAVVASEAGFSAIGTTASTAEADTDIVTVWTSADGTTWQAATVDDPSRKHFDAHVLSATGGPAGMLALVAFIAQDFGPYTLYRSADGMTWEALEPPRDDVLWATVAGTPDGYLLLGRTFSGKPSLWRSADGATWERVADAPKLHDLAVGADGTVVGIAKRAIIATTDLAEWTRVWQVTDVDATTKRDELAWIDRDAAPFVVAGVDFSACTPGIDECQQTFLLLSEDGLTWTESTGPDGLVGPDPATWFDDAAATADTAVVIGISGPNPTTAWTATPQLMPAGEMPEIAEVAPGT